MQTPFNKFYINDLSDSRLDYYRNLNFTPKIHSDNGVFIAEGTKTVRKLLSSDLKALSILCTEKYLVELEKEISEKNAGTPEIFIADKEIINNCVGFRLHEAVLAIGEQPLLKQLDELGEKICFLNGVVNSENVGSICRNALAFGIYSIAYDSATSSPFLRRSVRVSMGCVFYLDMNKSENNIDTIEFLKSIGYKIVAVEMAATSIPLAEFASIGKICYIFGTESKGIDAEILALADVILEVPMDSRADSLNVAASSAIVFHNDYYNSKINKMILL